MDIPIFSKGKEYISAVRAGEYVGYSSDYVGQLCRAGKIPAKLVGRTWFVDLDALKSHKENRVLGKPKKVQNGFSSVDTNSNSDSGLIASLTQEFTLDNPNPLHFKYDSDDTELLPSLVLKKKRLSANFSLNSSTGSVPNKYRKSILLVPAVALGLIIFVPLVMSSLAPSSIVKGSTMSNYAITLFSTSGRALSAAALLVNGIWSGTQSVEVSEDIDVNSVAYKQLFLDDEDSLNRAEIRLILLGEQSRMADSDTSSSISGSTKLDDGEALDPVENPFGIPEPI